MRAIIVILVFILLSSCLELENRRDVSSLDQCKTLLRSLLFAHKNVVIDGALSLPPSILPMKMKPNYRAENLHGGALKGTVRYLKDGEREAYRVFINDQKLLEYPNGDLVGVGELSGQVAIYVINPKGQIYMSYKYGKNLFHHSSFVAGGDVVAAGEMLIRDGVIRYISNNSGHYQPTRESLVAIRKVFVDHGVSVGIAE